MTPLVRPDAVLLLRTMQAKPTYSLAELTSHLGWLDSQGRPKRVQAHRLLVRDLGPLGLAKKYGTKWFLTKKGEAFLSDISQHHSATLGA